jgi:arginine utilization protein RocB
VSYVHWNNKEDILWLIKRLVKIPSISGTDAENVMADEIKMILKEIPYFQENPHLIYEKTIEGDSLARQTVAGLVRGNNDTSGKTIILFSHYDVVGIEDYGYLKSFAFDPDIYTDKLKDESLPEDITKELESGNWLFARGIMDMKAGLALQIALLSELCVKRDFPGNILLLTTPDEERNSEGMFAAVKLLHQIKVQEGKEYELAIFSEPSFASYPGDQSKYIYLGSVGKLLPLIFCSGKETHVGEPFQGVNAAWMASAFIANMELANNFIDKAGNTNNPPPTCLKLTDLKEQYNVQTPKHAYALYNVLTLQQTPAEVMDKLVETAKKSADDIYEKLKDSYQKFVDDANLNYIEKIKPQTFTYSQLYDMGVERYGQFFEKEMLEVFEYETAVYCDYRDLTVSIAKKISGFFPDLEPFYLLMYAPPYYPHVSLQNGNRRDEKILDLSRQIINYAKHQFNQDLKLQEYFMGLSDVSYCRLLDADKVIPSLGREMPLYGKKYHLPLKEIQELDIPTINIGPFGKDAHKRTERLELTFSTEQLPHLLREAVKAALEL